MKLLSPGFSVAAAAIAICSLMADELTFQESRALGKLASRLATRYGYAVTYEDAPTTEPYC